MSAISSLAVRVAPLPLLRRGKFLARPKNRSERVDTEHFEGVTIFWTGPEISPLPKKYYDATRHLADWAGDDWDKNDTTGFFRMRDFFVAACERWAKHDWQGDQEWISARQAEEREREKLAKHTKAFRLALRKSAARRLELELGLEMLAALAPSAEVNLQRGEAIEAISKALHQFEKKVAKPDGRRVRFGPAHYEAWPRKLPSRETVVALVLADLVTQFRRGKVGNKRPNRHRVPEVSPNTPWKAIAEFVKVEFDSDEQRISSDYVQSSVLSHVGKVTKIQVFPD